MSKPDINPGGNVTKSWAIDDVWRETTGGSTFIEQPAARTAIVEALENVSFEQLAQCFNSHVQLGSDHKSITWVDDDSMAPITALAIMPENGIALLDMTKLDEHGAGTIIADHLEKAIIKAGKDAPTAITSSANKDGQVATYLIRWHGGVSKHTRPVDDKPIGSYDAD
jgi:hypothetical protein